MSDTLPPPQGERPNDAVRERVFAESRRFRAMLPKLIPLYGGKWVVFRDGEVQSVYDNEDDALVAGVDRFGPDGGMVIAQVREVEVVWLSGIESLL